MLKVMNLNKKLKWRTIIDDLSMELDNGKYGLLGPNGAGKTTLMRCITGVYPTKKGTIVLDDTVYAGTKAFASTLGYMPQHFGILGDMKVKDALLYLADCKGVANKDALPMVTEALEKVNLSEKSSERVKNLSGGMVRRLGIAQALLGNPRVLIFDEPTAGLDPEERIRFKKVISNLSEDKIIIISTHIVSDIENLCGKVVVMNKGKIRYNGTVDELEKIGKNYSPSDERKEEIGNASMLERGYLCTLENC